MNNNRFWAANNWAGNKQRNFEEQPRYVGPTSRQQFYSRNEQPKKHSGCSAKRYTPTEGKNKGKNQVIVNAWTYRKGVGIVKYVARTTEKSHAKGVSEKGWIGSIAIEVIHVATGSKQLFWGTMQHSTMKVVCNDLGLVMNPKGGKGGYCGPFTK